MRHSSHQNGDALRSETKEEEEERKAKNQSIIDYFSFHGNRSLEYKLEWLYSVEFAELRNPFKYNTEKNEKSKAKRTEKVSFQ